MVADARLDESALHRGGGYTQHLIVSCDRRSGFEKEECRIVSYDTSLLRLRPLSLSLYTSQVRRCGRGVVVLLVHDPGQLQLQVRAVQ